MLARRRVASGEPPWMRLPSPFAVRHPPIRQAKRARIALFAGPFRPFFLAGAIWAAVAAILPLRAAGTGGLPGALSPADWHAHEMLYGYLSAAVGGFLLTAVPSWTGRAPLAGPRLVLMFSLWLAGRLTLAMPSLLGWPISAAIDLAFLPAVGAVALADVVAVRRWRDLRVMLAVAIVAAGNVMFDVAAAIGGTGDLGLRVGVCGAVLMIIVVGGRAVPGYTRTLLIQRDLAGATGRLPRPFSSFDAVSILFAVAALAAWVVRPFSSLTGVLLLVAGALHLIRTLRWAGERVRDNRIVLLLHLGYAFVAIGFAVTGLASLRPAAIPESAGIHAWTAGAIGLMTLAVMAHLTLRQTEGRLVVSPGMELVCAAAVLAAVLRPLAAIAASDRLMLVSGAMWVAAFAGFALVQGARLIRPARPLKDLS